MHPSSAGGILSVENLGPIAKADIDFGDLTILVGPQASGKSILLQTLKLQLDARHIATRLRLYGYTWEKTDHETFLELYFGEGLGRLWREQTRIRWNGKTSALKDLISVEHADPEGPLVSYIPAQRVLVMQNGWPRNFESYSQGDPYVVKGFSEYLRLQMERGSARAAAPCRATGAAPPSGHAESGPGRRLKRAPGGPPHSHNASNVQLSFTGALFFRGTTRGGATW